jgi:hypothetical protein
MRHDLLLRKKFQRQIQLLLHVQGGRGRQVDGVGHAERRPHHCGDLDEDSAEPTEELDDGGSNPGVEITADFGEDK